MQRSEMRKIFFNSWNKYQQKEFLEPLEAQVLSIILKHPEYHYLFISLENLYQEHALDQNPFLHMSLHLALWEQLNTDRPCGIKAIYTNLCTRFQNTHIAEHKMLDCLSSILWDAQIKGIAPDENNYLQELLRL